MKSVKLLSALVLALLLTGVGYKLLTPSSSSTALAENATSDRLKESVLEANREVEVSKIERIDKAFELEFRKTVDPKTGTVPRERLRAAYKKMSDVMPQLLAEKGNDNAQWEDRGPFNVGGRTRALLFDVADANNDYNTMFAGSVGGGIWRTKNFKAEEPTWEMLDDYMQNLAVTTIVQDPQNPAILYAGTGEGWQNADAIRGEGIFKSVDSGDTWNQIPSTANPDFFWNQELVMSSDGVLYAATNAGVMRSTDGGDNWTNVLSTTGGTASGVTNLPPGTDFAGAVQIASNGDVFVTFGKLLQQGSVFKSDAEDHGADVGTSGTWENITGPVVGFRLELALAPSDPEVAYIFALDAGLDCTSYYYTLTGGDNGAWVRNNAPLICDNGRQVAFTRLQAWYDLICAVDPSDPSTIYVGGVDALRGENANTPAVVWTQISSWVGGALCPPLGQDQFVHADQHIIIFEPGSSDKAVWGTDGGVFYTENVQSSFVLDGEYPTFVSKNTGYNVTQYYGADLANEFGVTEFLAGAQDNGSQRYTQEGFGETETVSGGDGCLVHVDRDNGDIQVSSFVYNSYFITNDRWKSNTRVEVGSQVGEFVNPTDLDSETNIMYCCADAGSMIRIDDIGGANAATTVTVGAFGTGKITTVAVSDNTENRVFFGLDNNDVIMVDNANTGNPVGTNITGDLPQEGNISCIAIDKDTDDHLLVTKSNYGIASVFETTDGGTTWVNVENDLPDMPVRWALFNPNDSDQALLATEMGVWTTDDLDGDQTIWMPTAMAHGFPNVRTDMLQVREVDNYMIAATHGRGLFGTSSYLESISVTFDKGFTQQVESDTDLQTIDDCPTNYRDLELGVTLTQSNGALAIPFGVAANSTATAGFDYDILTDNPLNFAGNNGGQETQKIVVRVYNDATVDGGAENIILELGQLPSGLDLGFFTQHEIKIQDDDVAPALTAGTDAITILAENFDDIPIGDTDEDWKIIEINDTGMNTWTTGSSEMLGTTAALVTFTPATPTDMYDSSDPNDNSNNIVLRTPLIDTRGLSNVRVSFDWAAGGENDTALGDPDPFDYGRLTYSLDGVNFIPVDDVFVSASPGVGQFSVGFYDSTIDVLGNTQFYLGFQWINDQLISGGFSFAVDELSVMALPKQLETVASSMQSATVAMGDEVYFYSTNNNALLAKIDAAAADLDCVDVTLDANGESTVDYQNGKRSDKAVKVENPTNTGYEVTIYLTTDELKGFTDAPLNLDPMDLKLTKFNGSLTTPTNAVIDANTQVTEIKDRADDSTLGYSYTSSAFNGFSWFAITNATLVDDPLAVTDLNFNARLVKNKYVELGWTVSQEIDLNRYEVERSFDGLAFNTIHNTVAKNAGNTTQQYTHQDRDLRNGKRYYRLRLVENDGQISYAPIRSLTIDAPSFAIYPNPVKEQLTIGFESKANMPLAIIELIDLNGQLIKKWNRDGAMELNFSLDGDLPSGTYLLRINRNGVLRSELITKL